MSTTGTFDANDLVWESMDSLNGRIHIISYDEQEAQMEDFPQLVDAAFIGAIAMLVIIAVLRLARIIARWYYGTDT